MKRLTIAAGVLALAAAGCRTAADAPDELPFELTLEFEGARSVSEARLGRVVREELVRLEVAAPDKAAVDDAAFALELFYQARGHASVLVDYEFDPTSPPRARFRIQEGPMVRVRELLLEGASGISPERVRSFFEPMANGGVYDELRLAQGLADLRRLYLERGYLRVRLDLAPPSFADDGTSVALAVTVREGPVFRVREVEVRGGIEAFAKRAREVTGEHQGNLFLPVVAPQVQHTLQEGYEHGGYPDARVEVRSKLDEESGDVRLTVEITPGERVTIDHFRISGNERTRDSAILGLIGIERGDVYDSAQIRRAFRDLYATGLFESVSLGLEGSGPGRTLAIELVEARSVEIRIEPGWGSYEGPRVLLGIEEKNFQGRGQSLSLEGTVSTRAQTARISWVDRDFLGSTFTSETDFFVEQREEPAFEFVRRGFGFFLRRPLASDWNTIFGYEYRPTDVDENGFVAPLPLDSDPSSDASVAALSAALVLDDRDNVLLPTRGRQGRARLEWANRSVGSDTDFLRAQLELTQLIPFGDKNVVVASARTGIIAPAGGTDFIPLPERFFNGGENSVRSFKEDELAPEGVGVSLGGEAATVLNLELRRELTGNLSGALFYDTGNVVSQAQDYLRFAGFRSGVGLGIRYLLPIGPVRLDLAFNPDAGPEEEDYVLHFSVGFPF